MKSSATDEDVNAFMEAVFPEMAHLARASFDEAWVLRTATKELLRLRAELASVTNQQARLREAFQNLVDAMPEQSVGHGHPMLKAWPAALAVLASPEASK